MSTEFSSVELVSADLLAKAPVKAKGKKRRSRGEGGLRFAANRNLWIATLPRQGRSPVTFYGKTEGEAKQKRDDYKRDIAAGRIDPSGRAVQLVGLSRNPTVGEWLEYWLEREVKPRYDEDGNREGGKQPTTYENYRWMANKHILPRAIARIKLDKLTVGDVETWWDTLRPERGKKVGMPSCYKAYVVLSGSIKRAITRRDVTSLLMNPVLVFGADDKVTKPRTAKKPVAPTPEAVEALFEAARGERLELVVHLGMRLGLRRQEICALRFGDFDLTHLDAKGAGRLIIRRRTNRLKGEGVVTRKGSKMQHESVEKEVPLSNPQRWAMLLEAHRQRTALFAAANTKTWDGPEPTSAWAWLFPTRTGNVMDPNEVYRWYKGIAAKAGLPERSMHQMRHDCASLGIEAGMSLWEVSQLLRHSSTNVTESVYGHITGAHEANLYSRVDSAIDRMLEAPSGAAASG